MEKFTYFNTSLGWCGIVSGEYGITRVLPGYGSPADLKDALERLYPAIKEGIDERLIKARAKITDYLKGEAVSFDIPIYLAQSTPFQKRVWEVTRTIPYGELRTYGWVSQRLSKPGACRAVGSALGANPLPLVIPCHRVVRSDGKLGGFSLPGGIDLKKRLIELETDN